MVARDVYIQTRLTKVQFNREKVQFNRRKVQFNREKFSSIQCSVPPCCKTFWLTFWWPSFLNTVLAAGRACAEKFFFWIRPGREILGERPTLAKFGKRLSFGRSEDTSTHFRTFNSSSILGRFCSKRAKTCSSRPKLPKIVKLKKNIPARGESTGRCQQATSLVVNFFCPCQYIYIKLKQYKKELIIREGVLIICNRYMKPMFVVFILFSKIVSRTSTYAAPNAEGCWWSVALVEMFVRKRMFSLIPSECVQ